MTDRAYQIILLSFLCICAMFCAFACKLPDRKQAIEENIKCIITSVKDSNYRDFQGCVNSSFNTRDPEMLHFDFVKLALMCKASKPDTHHLAYEYVPKGKYDRFDDFMNVDLTIYDGQGKMDSSTGALYMALHLGYDTSQGGATLMRFHVDDKYNGDYAEWLVDHGKQKDLYPGLDSGFFRH